MSDPRADTPKLSVRCREHRQSSERLVERRAASSISLEQMNISGDCNMSVGPSSADRRPAGLTDLSSDATRGTSALPFVACWRMSSQSI